MDDLDDRELEFELLEDPKQRPLALAAKAGDLPQVKRLLAGAIQETLGAALKVSAASGHAEVVKALAPLVTGANAREVALLDAGDGQHLDAAIALLPHTSPALKLDFLERLAASGWTEGALAVLKTLTPDEQVDTAMCRAAHKGDAELVQALMDYQPLAGGSSALRCAVSARHEACVRILATESDCRELVDSMKLNGSMAGDLDFLLPHLAPALQEEVLQIPVLAPFPNARALLHAQSLAKAVGCGTGSKPRI